MGEIDFRGKAVKLKGNFPVKGSKAPDFKMVKSDLSEVKLSDFKAKKIVFNIFPSVDTSVCATQLKTFSKEISDLDDVTLLFASMDLPFAFGRFCGAEGISNTVNLSDFRYHSLAENYGVKMEGGALQGLYARAVLVLDKDHTVVYSELVSEVTNEPNYKAAIEALKLT